MMKSGWNRQGYGGWNRQYPASGYRRRYYRRTNTVSRAIRRARWYNFARKVKSAMRSGKKTENKWNRTTALVPNNTVTAANYDVNFNLPLLAGATTIQGEERVYQKDIRAVMQLQSNHSDVQVIDLYLICNNNPQVDVSTDWLPIISGLGVPMGPNEIPHDLRKGFTTVYHRQFTLQPNGSYEHTMLIPDMYRKLGRYLCSEHNQGALSWYAKSDATGVLTPARITIQQVINWESRIGTYS